MARRRRVVVEVPRPSGHRRRVEWLKNSAILLLICSAVYLTGRSQLYADLTVAAGDTWLDSALEKLWGTTPAPNLGNITGRAAAARPVRIAVCAGTDQDRTARYAVQYDAAQTDRMFDGLSSFLSEALATAKNGRAVSEQRWRKALGEPGVYFDLLGTVPVSALYAWLGEGDANPVLTGEARRLLLAWGGTENATLYYSNENAGLYYAYDTSVRYQGYLEDEINGYDMGVRDASFAFERAGEEGYSGLYPYVLLPSAPATGPRVYRGTNPVPLTDEEKRRNLQQNLSFPDYYDVPEGLVIWEGVEKLRISRDGVAEFQAADTVEPRYPVPRAGAEPDVAEMIEAARGLAAETVGAWCGSARIYLMDLKQQEDQSWRVRFGYSLDGAAVQLENGACAADFTLRNGRIDTFTLTFRSYEDTGLRSAVMREKQAAAALNVLVGAGQELMLCYQDKGSEQVMANWAVD